MRFPLLRYGLAITYILDDCVVASPLAVVTGKTFDGREGARTASTAGTKPFLWYPATEQLQRMFILPG